MLEAAKPRLYRALRPGGWLVLGRMAVPPDPLAHAVSTLRIIRSGGADFGAKRLVAALAAVGCTAMRVVPRQGPAPMEYVIGRRRSSTSITSLTIVCLFKMSISAANMLAHH